MIDACTRSELYLQIASAYGITYSPDSLKVPIVNFINESFKRNINRYAQRVIAKMEKRRSDSRGKLYTKIGYQQSKIAMPSLLAVVLKNCKSIDDFMKEVIKMRRSRKVQTFRENLNNLDIAVKCDDEETMEKIHSSIALDLDGEKKEEAMIVKTFGKGLDKIKPVLVGTAALTGINDPNYALSISIIAASLECSQRLVSYFSNRRTMFISDISKQIQNLGSTNQELQRLFNHSISKNDLNCLDHLNTAYVRSIGMEN